MQDDLKETSYTESNNIKGQQAYFLLHLLQSFWLSEGEWIIVAVLFLNFFRRLDNLAFNKAWTDLKHRHLDSSG